MDITQFVPIFTIILALSTLTALLPTLNSLAKKLSCALSGTPLGGVVNSMIDSIHPSDPNNSTNGTKSDNNTNPIENLINEILGEGSTVSPISLSTPSTPTTKKSKGYNKVIDEAAKCVVDAIDEVAGSAKHMVVEMATENSKLASKLEDFFIKDKND